MQFTTAQMSRLAATATEAFMARAVSHLAEKHPAVCRRIGLPVVRGIVDRSLARCREHGCASQKCVMVLADLSLTHARDVYLNDGWVQEILASEHIDTAQKAQRLQSYL